MIVKCNSNQQEYMIEDYIGDEYYKCLYLYMDLKRYGIDSEKIEVYIQLTNGEIEAIFLIYYSCLHVFSRQNAFDLFEFWQYFKKIDFSMIYCERSTAEYLWQGLFDEVSPFFDMKFGWVARIDMVDKKDSGKAQVATDDDFFQIVSMIYEDEDIGKSYNIKELSRQLVERSKEGFSRNYVIKEGNLVIAHACTNAEVEDIAVVAELVVNKEYRRQGYASDIWRSLCGDLISENKMVFSFYYSDGSRALHKKIGFKEVCVWTKIVKRF